MRDLFNNVIQKSYFFMKVLLTGSTGQLGNKILNNMPKNIQLIKHPEKL